MNLKKYNEKTAHLTPFPQRFFTQHTFSFIHCLTHSSSRSRIHSFQQHKPWVRPAARSWGLQNAEAEGAESSSLRGGKGTGMGICLEATEALFSLRSCTCLWWLGGTGKEKKAQSQHTTKAGPMNMK